MHLSASDDGTIRTIGGQVSVYDALLASAPAGVVALLRVGEALGDVSDRTLGLLVGLFQDPVGFVQTLIFETIVGFALRVGLAVIDFVLVTFLGGDRALGQQANTTLGLLDLPIVAVTTGTSAARAGFGGLLDTVAAINGAIAAQFAQFGLAALPVATALALVEVAVFLYLAWVGVQAVATAADLSGLPLVSGLDSVLDLVGAILAPLRRLLAGVFGDG